MEFAGFVLLYRSELSKRVVTFGALLIAFSSLCYAQGVPGTNVNMVLGTTWPDGDPFAQRQNEPSMAVSSRNPQHLLAGSNDYRSVDIAFTGSTEERGDAWLSVYTSMDGGDTWKSTLLPGYPQDSSQVGMSSPLHGFTTATDPTVRAGTHGLFYYSGLAFDRGTNGPSGVFVAVFQDQNNKSNGNRAVQTQQNGAGNPFQYIRAALVDSGTSGQFLDKPWIAVDVPRTGRTATCKINGQTFSSGYVYIFYTLFNGSDNNPSSKIFTSVSKDCGNTWAKPIVLSNGLKIAQGTVATIDPTTGRVYVFLRQIASGNQPNAIYYQYSDNGGTSFVYVSAPVYTFPSGTAFDQNSNSVTFRNKSFPAVAVDASGKIWLAFSVRVTANGLPGSRIVMMTLPKGATAWTGPYQLDASAPTTGNAATRGHQFMPSLTFVSGKLMAAWYDSRRDNLMSTMVCKGGGTTCTVDQLVSQDVIIAGSQLAATPPNPAAVFTPTISDPTAPPGLRHTIDIYGGYLDTTTGATQVQAARVSQYKYYWDPADNVVKQGQFNVPNLPMFADGTIPFEGDYIDIAAATVVPDGKGAWMFNTLSSNTPVFHLTWADNRDVIPPSDNNWKLYVPPNSNLPWAGYPSSAYNGSGSVCPTCPTQQTACNSYAPGHTGDRNQNVYAAKFTAGVLAQFRENNKQLQGIPRAFSLNVRNTNSNLTNPTPYWYRIFINPTVNSPTSVSCSTAIPGGTAMFANTSSCFVDVQVPPLTTQSRLITVSSSNSGVTTNVLVAQISPDTIDNSGNFVPGSGAIIPASSGGLQAAVAINGDPSNPALLNPDSGGSNIALQPGYDPSNPDAGSPNGALATISTSEFYDPTTDAPDATSPAVTSPAVTSPAVTSPAVVSPAVVSPAVTSPAVVSPAVTAVQYVSPAVTSPAVTSPAVVSPAVVSPAVVSPAVTSPAVVSLADTGITDFTWRLNNKGNTTSTYNAKQFAKAAGIACGGQSGYQCQLLVRKVTGTPTPNLNPNTGVPTCDLSVSVQDQTVATIDSPAFTTNVATANSTDPGASTNPNVTVGAGEGLRVTLRVFGLKNGQAPPVPYKTVAVTAPDTGQTNAAASLTITALELPVAVITQPYTTNGCQLDANNHCIVTSANTVKLSSIGGFPGGISFYVPASPGTPQTPPARSNNLGGSGLNLTQAGQINPDVVSAAPGTYGSFDVQAQDTAQPLPAVDVQPLTIFVNQFVISAVTVSSNSNSTGNTAYVNPGDTVTVTVSLTTTGPTSATNATATLLLNAVAAGGGATPVVTCNSVTAQPVGPFTGTIPIVFTCMNATGNGYVTFTANATAHYLSHTGLYDTTATAATVYTPAQVPSATPPNVLVDTVKPTLQWAGPTTGPAGIGPGNMPWYNTPVIEKYATSDNLSGVYTRVPVLPATSADTNNYQAIQIASEGKGVTGQVTVTDFALNVASPGTANSPTSPGFNIDTTKPTISGAPDRASNPNNWYNNSVTVTFTCNDPNPATPASLQALGAQPLASGVASCTSPVTLSQEGVGQSVTGNVADYATNTNSTSVMGINIDRTAPTITGSTDRAANPQGWYNAPVTVSFLCADPPPTNPAPPPVSPTPSGIGFCTAPVKLSSDGASQSVPGTATDNAGNGAGTTVSGINIDQTPPVMATPTASAGGNAYTANTWTNQDVAVTFTCTDNLSGPLVTNTVTNPVITGLPATGATVAYQSSNNGLISTATVTLTSETSSSGVTLHASCQDNAGNSDVGTTNHTLVSFGPVLIDKTPPTVTGFANIASSSGPSYTAGTWTNQSVVVGFTCSDSLSGPAPGTTTAATTESAQGIYNVQGSCQDVAGNTGTGSFGPIYIDTTTPGVVISSPQMQMYLLNQQITPNFTCGDNSGGDTATCTATPPASPYTAITVGPASFSVHAVDQAGNATNPDPSVNYLVVYNFTGFQAPLQNAVMMNPVPTPATSPQPGDSGSFTIGTTIPVAWTLHDGAATPAALTDPATLLSIVAYPNATCTGPASGAGTTLYDANTNTSSFSYDSSHSRFLFNWNTTGMSAGCYNLVVTTNDTAQWSTIVHLASDTFVGFDTPLANASAPASPSNSGTFDIGSTIPMMWQLQTTGASPAPDTTPNVSLSNVTVYSNAACSGPPQAGATGSILYDKASNAGSFNFEITDAVYTMNWDTTNFAAGCYDVVVTLNDQSVYATMVTLAAPGPTSPTTLLQYNFDNLPQGSTALVPSSFATYHVSGLPFAVSNGTDAGTNAVGCEAVDCFDSTNVVTGATYTWAINNLDSVTSLNLQSVSFHAFTDDCSGTPSGCGQTFVLEYSTDNFTTATPVGNSFNPVGATSDYTFQLGAVAVAPSTSVSFRIRATGNPGATTAQYTFDNVTVTGTH